MWVAGTILLLAFSASPHCAGMCGPIGLSVGSRRPLWHIGRISGYTAIGAALGALGRGLGDLGWPGLLFAGTLLAWSSARLAGLLPAAPSGLPPLLQRLGRLGPIGLGLATALLPCGLLQGAAALPIAAGDPWFGAGAMALFGLGTLPAIELAGFTLSRLRLDSPLRKRLFAVAVFCAGLLGLGLRFAMDSGADCAR
jgi:sulfite exporter TauE/SafE